MALPPAARLPPSSVASTLISIRGRPSMTTRWAPSPPSGGIGQSVAQSAEIRVTCSTTIRGSPPTMPCTSKRSAPWVPASKSPIELVTSASSGRRSRVSRISSSSTPSARAIIRTWPPHTMVGTPAATIGGS